MAKRKLNWFDRLAVRFMERRSLSLSYPTPELIEALLGGETSYTGKSVTVEGSLSVTAIYAGITILANTISSLPLHLYRRLDRGKERATDRSEYRLMHDAPNPEHTSLVFRELMTGHLVGWGNFYGQMIFDRGGRVSEIWPLNPARMEVFRENGERKYLYTRMDGKPIPFTAEQILHVPAFGFDGLVGYSPIRLARNAIGLAMTVEEYGSRIFSNGARPAVVLKHPAKLTDPKVVERLKASWNDAYGGVGNVGKTAILEEGMDLKEIGFPPEDAQFLALRAFQIDEIARLLNIPAWMLGNVDRSTSWGTGIEQQRIGFLAHTIQPWLTRIEQQLNKDILLPADQLDYFYEHLTAAMLRSDTTARFTAYTQAVTNGWMTRNEVREAENMNPLDGLDEPLVPLNMTSGNQPKELPASQNGTGRTLEPLYQDALNRALRREVHDVQEILRRAKGNAAKIDEGLVQFYNIDHPDFLTLQLVPVVQAHSRMLDLEWDEQRVKTVSAETARMLCTEHLAQLEGNLLPEQTFQAWTMTDLAAQLAARSTL